MAQKMYRETVAKSGKALAKGWTAVMKVLPLDGDQAPGAYLKSLKLSVCPGDTDTFNQEYLIAAATTATGPQDSDIITSQAFHGAGTAWLNLRRVIRSSDVEDARSDGPVYIHVFTASAHTAMVVAEAWGRFTNLESA